MRDYTSILTYEDACSALGESINESALSEAGVTRQIIAQMKCEFVAKAINGGTSISDFYGRKIWEPIFLTYRNISEAYKDIFSHGEREFCAVDIGHKYIPDTVLAGPIPGYNDSLYKNIYSQKASLYFDCAEKARHFGKHFMGLWLEAYIDCSVEYDSSRIFTIQCPTRLPEDEEFWERRTNKWKYNIGKMRLLWFVMGAVVTILYQLVSRLF